jgi:hypothetical protein
VKKVEDAPFLHVGLFKRLRFATTMPGMKHKRILTSSATSGNGSSMIQLDNISSEYQSRSSLAILKDFVGEKMRTLVIIDSAKSLSPRGQLTARMAAAMVLKPLASDIHFLLTDSEDPASIKWGLLQKVLEHSNDLLVYGFTWILWLSWGAAKIPENIIPSLLNTRIHFVHSGGWKKLEAIKVDRERFDSALLQNLDPASKVVDYYGLVEQVGVIYPLCEKGFRHVPVWADVIVRDPITLEPMVDEVGQLQLLNVITFGAPNHSVLTEDLGMIVSGECPCGRQGKRFKLIGRIPKAEIRGCANV